MKLVVARKELDSAPSQLEIRDLTQRLARTHPSRVYDCPAEWTFRRASLQVAYEKKYDRLQCYSAWSCHILAESSVTECASQ